jgi:hypothetical protein
MGFVELKEKTGLPSVLLKFSAFLLLELTRRELENFEVLLEKKGILILERK